MALIRDLVPTLAIVLALVLSLGAGGVGTATGEATGPTVASVASDSAIEAGGEIGPSPATLSVALDGTPVSDDGSITTADNPNLSIRAAGETRIDLIAVRIDGTTERSFAPNTTTFAETTQLDLTAGDHDLRIVVETNRSTKTFTATVVEDSIPPVMTFESPFSTENSSIYGEPNDSYTLHEGEVLLQGTLHDHSSVERVDIDLAYNELGENSQWGYRNHTTIEDPGSSISHPLKLGPRTHPLGTGTNKLTVTLEDSFGQVRWYEVSLFVKDNEAPEIQVLDQTAVKERSAVEFTARARDRVGLRSVGSRIGPEDGAGLTYALPPTPVPSRPLEVTFTRTVPVLESSEVITISASDGNQTTTRRYAVNYTELVTPRIDLAEADVESVRPGVIHVTGRVYDGSISRVYIETVAPDGDIIDLNQVHGGTITDTVEIDESLRMNVYPASVRVRAVDVSGTEHLRSIQLSRSNVTGDRLTTTPPTNTTTPPTSTQPETTTPTTTAQVTLSDSGPPLTSTDEGGGVLDSIVRFVRETILSPFSGIVVPGVGI